MLARQFSSVLLVLLVSFVAATSRSARSLSSLISRATLPPSEDPFYQPPRDYEHTVPGTILRHRTLNGVKAVEVVPHVYQLLYRTTNAQQQPSVTVTTVLIPLNANLKRLLSYQLFYDQADEDCSPSYDLEPGSNTNRSTSETFEVDVLINQALLRGIPVSTSDYEGEDAAFTAGPQSAYGTLDSIKAVLASESITGISRDAVPVMFGYSGGSIATEWAAEFQASYAPGLKILGAALGGLPTNLTTALLTLNGTDESSLAPASILGLGAAYPRAAHFLRNNLIPSKAHEFRQPRHQCDTTLSSNNVFSYFKTGNRVLYDADLVAVVKKAGVMGLHGTPKSFPLYIYKGTADDVVGGINETDALVKKYCAAGSTIEYVRYTNGTHAGTAVQGSLPALQFLFDLLDGIGAPKKCTTQNIPSTNVSA